MKHRDQYLVKADFTACDAAFPFDGVRWFGVGGIHDDGCLRPFDNAMMAHCWAVGFDTALALMTHAEDRPFVSLEQAKAAPFDVQRRLSGHDNEGGCHA